RTTSAFITWPFFTRPRGIASLTDTTMMSPIDAYLRCEPPSTLMHMTRRAPELSATSRLDCIWIMASCLLVYASPHGESWSGLGVLNESPALVLRNRRALFDPN